MNDRERFLATMRYQPRDRAPICDFGFWKETIPTWHAQGLPKKVRWGVKGKPDNTDEFFGMDKYWSWMGAHMHFWPEFEARVIEDRAETRLVMQYDGVVVEESKTHSTIPTHVGHTLVDRQSWREHYAWRFDPDDPRRYPQNWPEKKRQWQTVEGRTEPLIIGNLSLFGRLRDFMGLENIALVPYDDPAWFEEMVAAQADCFIGVAKRLFDNGAVVDGCAMWEDMSYSGGPLLSPGLFKQFLVPHYKRVTDFLRSKGVDIIWVDSDGKIDDLLPLWMEGGVNCMFPIEVGTWGADPVKFRKQYGKSLLMMGGFSKKILSGSKEGIRAEVLRLTPVVEEGGYIPFADHRVPPDVPLENYMYYLKCAREVWGKGVNLKPMGRIRRPGGSAS